MLKSIVA